MLTQPDLGDCPPPATGPLPRLDSLPKVINWSRVVGNIGRTLITAGALTLLFVAYQLWGTSLQERRAQADLRSEFTSSLTENPTTATLTGLDNADLPARIESRVLLTTDDDRQLRSGTVLVDPTALVIDPTAAVFGPPPPPADDGEAIARLRIPAIDLDKVVVEGVGSQALKEGPGHYPSTPLPGQAGNAAIAGHRTTYGAPFHDLDQLKEHDLIYVTTRQGAFQYAVSATMIVSPDDVSVLDSTDADQLTLTTCHPKYSARQRLIVVADLIGPPASLNPDDLGGSPRPEGNDDGRTDAEAERPVEAERSADADPVLAVPSTSGGTGSPVGDQRSRTAELDLDGIRAPVWPAVLWAVLAGLLWAATWGTGRLWRRWPAYTIGVLPVLGSLFMFFENFSRLLPPGI